MDKTEHEDMGLVDVHPEVHHATEDDEEAVLRWLYGPPDEDGIYRGDGS